jgi:hypothetical protein
MGLAMRFNMRIIACVALASIAITAVVASSFSKPKSLSVPSLSPSPTPSPASTVPHIFDVDLTYAYVGKINVSEHSHFGMGVHSANLYPALIHFNCTYIGDREEPWDIKFEGYLVRLASDTGTSAEYKAYQGFEFNESSDPFVDLPDADSIVFGPLLPPNESLYIQFSDSGSFTSGDSDFGLWSNGPPNTITLTLYRIGWWNVKNGLVSIVGNPEREEVLFQVQLEGFTDGFLYNKLVPENKLAELDPFEPPL